MTLSRYMSIGSALVVAMILTRLLDEDVYGAYRKLWLLFAISGPVFINSLANTLYYRGSDDKDRDPAIWAALFLGLVYGLGTGGIAWAFASFWAGQLNVDGLEAGFRMFAPYMALAVFAGMAEPVFIILKRKKWLVGYSAGYNLIESALIVVPFALGLPIEKVVLIMSAGPALRSLVLIGLCLTSSGRFPEMASIKSELPVSFKYGAGIMALSIAGIIAAEADKWVIGSFFESDALFAIYVIGAKKIPFIMALTSAVSATIVSEFATRLRQGDFSDALAEARKASSRLSLIIVPVVVWLFIFAEEVMVLLFGKYEASAPVFRVYILTVLTQLIFPHSIVLGMGRSDVNAKVGALEALINITLSIVFVMSIGFMGPAYATLIAHVFFTGTMLFYCRRAYGIRSKNLMPDKRIMPLLWMLPVIALAGYSIKFLAGFGWMGFALTGILAGTIIAFTLKRKGF